MGPKRRLILAAATAMIIAPVITQPSHSPAQSAPAALAPAPSATTATSQPASAPVVEPATVLRATTSTQSERDEAARRLVQRQSDASKQVLVEALQDVANRSGQIAVARALQSDLSPDPIFVAPLFALVDKSDDLSELAMSALANYHDDPAVMARIVDIATDRAQKPGTRLAAVKAMGTMSDKHAAAALIALISSDAETQPMRTAAAGALSEMTGLSAAQDVTQWQAWWAKNRTLPEAAFQQQILADSRARLRLLEQRFKRVVAESQSMLSEGYQSATEKAREVTLLKYLRANEAETRLVGVRLIREDFQNNRPIPPMASAQLRTMVGDSSSQVRIDVARALRLLNDPAALTAVLEQLKNEPDPEVRAALADLLAAPHDLRVVEPLLALLRDPSTHVAEVAANGLRDLGPDIQKDKNLAAKVARELRATLESHPAASGVAPLRAALVDAMGALQDPTLQPVYIRVLRPSEATIVRRASLRALGKMEQPWAAEIIANSLDDPDDTVRLEAINALSTTANFANAEKLYSVYKNPNEKAENRRRAWLVLRNLFPGTTATNDALFRWADRFMDDPERRIEIFEVLRDRFTREKNERDLAIVQQNIGEEKMKLADIATRNGDPTAAKDRASQAEIYFDLALQYYNSHNAGDQTMVTSAVLERRMDALLASQQYAKASQFAAESITRSSTNQDSMGRKLSNEVERLRTAKQYNDAVQLIEAINGMNPKLADTFAGRIKTMETDVRQKLAANNGPQSAVGSGH